MSVRAMAWVWEQPIENPTEKLVLLAIADSASHDGRCWPSYARIAEKAGCSKRTVERYVAALAHQGLVVRKRRRRSDGALGTYEYWLPLNGQATLELTHQSPSEVNQSPQVAGRPVATSGDAEPSVDLEPSLKPLRPVAKLATGTRERDELFEAVADVCGINWTNGQLTPSARGQLNRAVKELRQVGANPDDVHQRAKGWRHRYPDTNLTPSALAKHWPALIEGSKPRRKECTVCRGLLNDFHGPDGGCRDRPGWDPTIP